MARFILYALTMTLAIGAAQIPQLSRAQDAPQETAKQGTATIPESNILPQAPKELSGFKLDAPKETNEDQNIAAPIAAAPTTQQNPNNDNINTRPTDQARARASPVTTRSSARNNNRSNKPNIAPRSITPSNSNAAKVQDNAAALPTQTTSAAMSKDSRENIEAAKTKGAQTMEATNDNTHWSLTPPVIMGVILAILAAIGSVIFIKYRKQRNDDAQDVIVAPTTNQNIPPLMPSAKKNLITTAEDSPPTDGFSPAQSSLEQASPQQNPVKPKARPELEMRFEPKKATLTLTRLILTGDLKIVNHGKAMARNIQLRNQAICASDNQAKMLSAFMNDKSSEGAQKLENIRKGERLSLSIEIAMLREELDIYNIEGREICAPILLADLEWSGLHDTQPSQIYIASMIGRISGQENDRMGPLRLDLGPRSFTDLEQRKVTI